MLCMSVFPIVFILHFLGVSLYITENNRPEHVCTVSSMCCVCVCVYICVCVYVYTVFC